LSTPPTLLTPRRVAIYPRLVLFVIATAILLNLAGSSGWRGWGGQVLFHDFVIFYGAGTLLRDAPHSLYDFDAQLSLQRRLVAPTPLEGTGPFSHPPYVASLLELVTGLSLPYALIIWTGFSCVALAGSIWLVHRLVRKHLRSLHVPTQALAVTALSLAPVLFGLYSGQMHTFVLLGSVAVVLLVLDEKPWQAGAVAGLLAIKPQVTLAFLIFFVARRNVRAFIAATLAFIGLNALLVGMVGVETAIALYADYLATTQSLLQLPFVDGFPSYLLLTPHGFMSGLVGPGRQGLILAISSLLAVATVLWFLWDCWRRRHSREESAPWLLGRTLLLPSLVTPYLMMYDAAPMVLACGLLVPPSMPGRALRLTAIVYAALWVYPLLSAATGVPLGALVPVGLWMTTSYSRSPQDQS
jgi:arabinofuranan 3-O-arabinosyltransferase